MICLKQGKKRSILGAHNLDLSGQKHKQSIKGYDEKTRTGTQKKSHGCIGRKCPSSNLGKTSSLIAILKNFALCTRLSTNYVIIQHSLDIAAQLTKRSLRLSHWSLYIIGTFLLLTH